MKSLTNICGLSKIVTTAISCALAAVLMVSGVSMSACSKNIKQIQVGQMPNEVVQNCQVSSDYSEISEKISADVISEFMALTKVPRPSGHTEKITAYLLQKLAEYGISGNIDETSGCIYADLAANGTNGSAAPCVIMQAHTDMVSTAASNNSGFDFTTQPLDVVYDEASGQIHSRDYKTNIGCDDGQGIALILALAKNKDSFNHGNIRFLFTPNEEIGCLGAKYVSPEVLNTNYILNVDGCQIGNITSASAGMYLGIGEANYATEMPEVSDQIISVELTGLIGGHTGKDVTKKRVHASAFAINLCKKLKEEGVDFKLASISSGSTFNAYPTSLGVKLYVNNAQADKALEVANNLCEEAKAQCTDDPSFSSKCDKSNESIKTLSKAQTKTLVEELSTLPEGVIAASDIDADVPETSVSSGIFSLTDGKLNLSFFLRSSNNSAIEHYKKFFNEFATKNGISLSKNETMLAWEHKDDNLLANNLLNSYKDVGGFEGKETITQICLESSYFAEKRPDLCMVCVGLDYENEHMTNETIYTRTIPMHVATILYTLQNIHK